MVNSSANISLIELHKNNKFVETKIKPHTKETLLYSVSVDHKYLGSLGNKKSEIILSDIQNEFKPLYKVSFGIFDRKWDSILSSGKIHMTILAKNLIAFYSEKLTFRFINFGKSKQSTFNFLEQNKYSKFDFKPCDKNLLLPCNEGNTVLPIIRNQVFNPDSDDCSHLIVNSIGSFPP